MDSDNQTQNNVGTASVLQSLSCSRANRSLKRSQVVKRCKAAGVIVPIRRLSRTLKRESFIARVGTSACVYLGAVLQYLAAEVLELSGNCARENFKNRIHPRHIQLAVHADPELRTVFNGATIPSAGVAPFIHPVLMPATRSGLAALEEPSFATTTTMDESSAYTVGTSYMGLMSLSNPDDSSHLISSTHSNGPY